MKRDGFCDSSSSCPLLHHTGSYRHLTWFRKPVVGAPHRALGCLAHALEGGVRRRQRGVGTLPGPRITIPESMAKTASSASQRPKSRLAHGSPLSPAKVSVQEVVVEGQVEGVDGRRRYGGMQRMAAACAAG